MIMGIIRSKEFWIGAAVGYFLLPRVAVLVKGQLASMRGSTAAA